MIGIQAYAIHIPFLPDRYICACCVALYYPESLPT